MRHHEEKLGCTSKWTCRAPVDPDEFSSRGRPDRVGRCIATLWGSTFACGLQETSGSSGVRRDTSPLFHCLPAVRLVGRGIINQGKTWVGEAKKESTPSMKHRNSIEGLLRSTVLPPHPSHSPDAAYSAPPQMDSTAPSTPPRWSPSGYASGSRRHCHTWASREPLSACSSAYQKWPTSVGTFECPRSIK